MSWSAEQQGMLNAMGYQLLVRTPTATPFVDGAIGAGPAVPEPGVKDAAGSETHAALRQALRRAAGDQDVSGLVHDLERLRREPALKRALWPRLRALRRSH